MFRYRYDFTILLCRAALFGSVLLLLVLVGMESFYIFRGYQSSRGESLDSSLNRVVIENAAAQVESISH